MSQVTPHRSVEKIAGVILAGGAGSRMGGANKALVRLGGKPLIERAIATFSPQVGHLAISVHDQTDGLERYAFPLLADDAGERSGPTAGLRAALRWAADKKGSKWLALAPVDAPFLPSDFVSTLIAAAERNNARAAFAAAGERFHPTVSAWSMRASSDFTRLLDEGLLALRDILRKVDATRVRFEDEAAFMNVNTPEDIGAAEEALSR